MASSAPTNALSNETSPYLLQHANNPVAWFPWGEEALAKARSEGKPILLSVGYSACHWCHVMAHESFEDDATAATMNEHFVNIKVDREERPDIDKIYQAAHQLLTRRAGGWPLTMFLTPEDHAPFFGGTYFPKEPRFGMPAFNDVLLRVAEVHRTKRTEIRDQNVSLVEALRGMEPVSQGDEIVSPQPLTRAVAELKRSFDPHHGGFGQAPKFPHPTNIDRLLRHYVDSVLENRADTGALHAATFTLQKMAEGGVYDHLGGGFCRYSVDAYWMIPHFEKMLYDNGPLLALCAQAWQISKEPVFEQVALETAQWVIREMQSPDGGYYSTLDADSEGEEGKFYVWDRDQVRGLLDESEYKVLAMVFGLDVEPNFEGRHWHLHTYNALAQVAAATELPEDRASELLRSAKQKLLCVRERRVRPGLDDKILTSWNGLMIRGMAIAGRVFERETFIESAERALDFIRERMWTNGQLLATAKGDRAHLNAYLDDYALLIDGILSLLECRWREGDLGFAIELADTLLAKFEDTEHGGFFFTANDHERLIHRPKPMIDDALPAGNGMAAFVLQRLGHLLGDMRYLEAAERAIRAAWPGVSSYPHAHNALLLAVEEHLDPPQTIVLRGTGPELDQWRARCLRHYAPRRVCLAIPLQATSLPGLLAERTAEQTTAYVCHGHTCDAPISELAVLDETLRQSELDEVHKAALGKR